MLTTIAHADFGGSRTIALTTATDNLRDRSYLLDRQKILWASLAEGDMDTAQASADYVYDQLRTQGVNRGKAVGRFFVGDSSVLVWKGEPFEQAAGFAAVAIVDGLSGDWGNMRASALGSLFQLRDLEGVVEGERGSNPRAGALTDRELLVAGVERNEHAETDEAYENSLPLTASDFEPGYALAALAEREMGLHEELDESLRKLVAVNPQLQDLADQIRNGSYNTILVVDYGLGPRKIQTGPDGAIAGFQARTFSDPAPLSVNVNGALDRFPVLTDYNRLSADLKWNNFEDVRIAKSQIGSALMVGGGITAIASDDSTAQLIGLGLLLAGAALRSSSSADTRHLEALPQRTYLALVTLPEGASRVEIQVDGRPESRLVLPDLPSRGPSDLRLWYVRLPTAGAPWATPPSVVYSNDATGGATDAPDLPYILGGRCVRTPSEDLLREYRRAGLPAWVTVADLERMYAEEGIALPDTGVIATGRHVLEGGAAMYTPPAGSAGFVRLFCQPHPPYAPRGETANQILREMHAQTHGETSE
ncbi:MAG: hypothetical protein R3B57_10880 [Phycisphaerales bacterium]